jgi:hypothetical protein
VNISPTIDSPKPKPFTWSYSALKNYETCPRRYHECNVKKAWPEESIELDRGQRLHKAMYARVGKNTPLPIEFAYMEEVAVLLTNTSDPYFCELKLAVDENMRMVPYFGKRVWCRGLIDYCLLSPLGDSGRLIATIADYKTGKPKNDETQLALNACLAFAYDQNIAGVNTSYVWTEYEDTSHATYMRRDAKDIWEHVKPRVAKLETATIAGEFPPTKNSLCREYCPVLSCEFNGKR